MLEIGPKACTKKEGRPLIAYTLCPLPVTEDYPANAQVVALLRDYCPKNVLRNGPNHILKDAMGFQWVKWEENKARNWTQTNQLDGMDRDWERERVEMFRLLLEHHHRVSPHLPNGSSPYPQPPSVHDIIESFGTGLPPEFIKALISAVPPSHISSMPDSTPNSANDKKRQNKPSVLRRLQWTMIQKVKREPRRYS
jgi:hypothetical protein